VLHEPVLDARVVDLFWGHASGNGVAPVPDKEPQGWSAEPSAAVDSTQRRSLGTPGLRSRAQTFG